MSVTDKPTKRTKKQQDEAVKRARNVADKVAGKQVRDNLLGKKPIRRPDKPKIPRRSSYVAPGCSACAGVRPKIKGTDNPENYSRVYGVKQYVRYIRCGFCGHTWTVPK